MSDDRPTYSSDELISQRVNHLLFLHKLSRRQAATELGMSTSAFNTKINGGSSWKADELVHLTDRFGVTFDFLVGRQPIEFAISRPAATPPDLADPHPAAASPGSDRMLGDR